MSELLNSPMFGILVTLLSYQCGLFLAKISKLKIVNPLLMSIILIMLLLQVPGLSYEQYAKGGDMISFLIVPATVVLAVPLYKNVALLKKNLLPIVLGVVVGALVNFFMLYIFLQMGLLSETFFLSLLPKSVTTPIGMELSMGIGGIREITVAAIILSGLTGVMFGPLCIKLFSIKDPVAIGVAYGTTSHALGTAKAMEEGEISGGMSGLSIGVAGLLTAVIIPLLLKIFL